LHLRLDWLVIDGEFDAPWIDGENAGKSSYNSWAGPHLAGLNVIDRRGRNLGRHGKLLLREMMLLPQLTQCSHAASFRDKPSLFSA